MMWNVNYLAIVVAAIASFVLGMLWYSPMLFGKLWMKLEGMDPKKMKKQKKDMGAMAPQLVTQLVCLFITAAVLDLLVLNLGITSMVGAVEVALLVWLGFMMTEQIGIVLWQSKPKELFFLKTAESLVYLVLMAVVLASL